MSEVPPRTTIDWGWPKASITTGSPSAGRGPMPAARRGRARSADCGELAQSRVHGGDQLGPQAGVLGQIDAAPRRGDALVEAVEQRG